MTKHCSKYWLQCKSHSALEWFHFKKSMNFWFSTKNMICETYHEIICYLADLFIIIKGERGSLELFLGKEVAINTLQSRGQSFTSLMAVFCQDINSVVFSYTHRRCLNGIFPWSNCYHNSLYYQNIPLWHLLNEKLLSMSWRRSKWQIEKHMFVGQNLLIRLLIISLQEKKRNTLINSLHSSSYLTTIPNCSACNII